jgi:hypothetical protein
VPGVVQLGGQPDLIARHARRPDALADLLLVAVGEGRVDVAVASTEGSLNGLADLAGLGLPCTQPNSGNLSPRVELVGLTEGVVSMKGPGLSRMRGRCCLRGVLDIGHGCVCLVKGQLKRSQDNGVIQGPPSAFIHKPDQPKRGGTSHPTFEQLRNTQTYDVIRVHPRTVPRAVCNPKNPLRLGGSGVSAGWRFAAGRFG